MKNAHKSRANTRDSDIAGPSESKPDIFFSYPIEHRNIRSEYQIGFPLTSLEEHKNSFDLEESYAFDAKLVCFPWAIIEIKKGKQDRLKCYRQAANGCSTALSIMEYLTRHHGKSHSPEHIPPIISVTVIAFQVRLWLAYTKELVPSKKGS